MGPACFSLVESGIDLGGPRDRPVDQIWYPQDLIMVPAVTEERCVNESQEARESTRAELREECSMNPSCSAFTEHPFPHGKESRVRFQTRKLPALSTTVGSLGSVGCCLPTDAREEKSKTHS